MLVNHEISRFGKAAAKQRKRRHFTFFGNRVEGISTYLDKPVFEKVLASSNQISFPTFLQRRLFDKQEFSPAAFPAERANAFQFHV